MKKLHITFIALLLLLPSLTIAQSKVNASDIVAMVNRGAAVSFKNAEIVGDLNLTRLQNMKLKNGAKDSNSKEYLSVVKVPMTFVGCTFKGDVLAYFNPGNGMSFGHAQNEVYNTDFEKMVRFENCTFTQESAFKYSDFKGGASFAGSRFSEEALFKYSDFAEVADFSDAKFAEGANFKYVDFPVMAEFNGAVFGGEADFKYTKFLRGVSFQKAVFNGLANFKYSKLSEPFSIKGAAFNGGDDFKYTTLDNRAVSFATILESHR